MAEKKRIVSTRVLKPSQPPPVPHSIKRPCMFSTPKDRHMVWISESAQPMLGEADVICMGCLEEELHVMKDLQDLINPPPAQGA